MSERLLRSFSKLDIAKKIRHPINARCFFCLQESCTQPVTPTKANRMAIACRHPACHLPPPHFLVLRTQIHCSIFTCGRAGAEAAMGEPGFVDEMDVVHGPFAPRHAGTPVAMAHRSQLTSCARAPSTFWRHTRSRYSAAFA